MDAKNSRLPFLTAQLWQVQLRNHIANARTAIRDKRFEDAGNSVAAAIALNLGDMTEIDAVRAELAEARSAQQVDEVLDMANARLDEGRLLSPANDNARYYYNLMLSNDPNNTAARQGLNVVASKLVLQARTEIDAGNFDSAETLLDNARAIDPANSELTATVATLVDARDASIRREQVAAQERRRNEEANRQAAADKAAADKAAAERQQRRSRGSSSSGSKQRRPNWQQQKRPVTRLTTLPMLVSAQKRGLSMTRSPSPRLRVSLRNRHPQ